MIYCRERPKNTQNREFHSLTQGREWEKGGNKLVRRKEAERVGNGY